MTPRARPRLRAAVGTLFLAGAGLLPLAGSACGETKPRTYEPASTKRPTSAVVTLPAVDGAIEVAVELAVTPAERDRGLMHRTELSADAGMLFVFPTDEPRTFWMQNTLIPLDIVFLDADGTIQNIAHGEPFVERPGYHSARPARMVLELNAGWCAAHGVRPGSKVAVPAAVLALPKS
jgi:uncharacterized membrane protein (UPF0127 family)